SVSLRLQLADASVHLGAHLLARALEAVDERHGHQVARRGNPDLDAEPAGEADRRLARGALVAVLAVLGHVHAVDVDFAECLLGILDVTLAVDADPILIDVLPVATLHAG